MSPFQPFHVLSFCRLHGTAQRQHAQGTDVGGLGCRAPAPDGRVAAPDRGPAEAVPVGHDSPQRFAAVLARLLETVIVNFLVDRV